MPVAPSSIPAQRSISQTGQSQSAALPSAGEASLGARPDGVGGRGLPQREAGTPDAGSLYWVPTGHHSRPSPLTLPGQAPCRVAGLFPDLQLLAFVRAREGLAPFLGGLEGS